MPLQLIDQIIDATLQNERRPLRPGRPDPLDRVPRAPRSLAALKPAWCELPPEAAREALLS